MASFCELIGDGCAVVSVSLNAHSQRLSAINAVRNDGQVRGVTYRSEATLWRCFEMFVEIDDLVIGHKDGRQAEDEKGHLEISSRCVRITMALSSSTLADGVSGFSA